MITQNTIKRWLERAKEENATYMLVICDTFDYDDYPVMVTKDKNVQDVIEKYRNSSMQKIMEVYNLNQDLEQQLNQNRAWNI